MASASFGADAYTSDESVACDRAQRRLTTQEGAVAAGGPQGTGIHRIGSLGHPATAGLTRLARSTHAEDPGADACAGTGSGEACGDAATDDASRSRPVDGSGL